MTSADGRGKIQKNLISVSCLQIEVEFFGRTVERHFFEAGPAHLHTPVLHSAPQSTF